ncbi:DUF4232 domain-containing protein [Streptomyces sp. NPDC054837]
MSMIRNDTAGEVAHSSGLCRIVSSVGPFESCDDTRGITMGAARKSWKTYTLGAVAVAALLASTACEPGGGTDDKADTTPSASPTASDSATPGGSAGAGGSGDTGGSGEDATRACADPDLSVATSVYPHDEVRHLLVTATNAGDTPCTLYHYPRVYLGDETENPLGPMESKPQAVATIEPGEKAYAGLFLFRAGEKTTTVESLGLGYMERVPNSDEEGAPLDIRLPDGTDFLTPGPNPGVTYWNTDLDAVEKFTFAR